jgi:hypothetical protein
MSNFMITASGNVTLCKWPYSSLDGVRSQPVHYIGRLYVSVKIPDAVIIQLDLLRMSIVLLETCRG